MTFLQVSPMIIEKVQIKVHPEQDKQHLDGLQVFFGFFSILQPHDQGKWEKHEPEGDIVKNIPHLHSFLVVYNF